MCFKYDSNYPDNDTWKYRRYVHVSDHNISGILGREEKEWMEKEEKTDRCILKKKKRERLNTFKDLAVRVSWEDKMKEG